MKGAWGKAGETAHKTLSTGRLGFLATSAAEVANLAALGFFQIQLEAIELTH